MDDLSPRPRIPYKITDNIEIFEAVQKLIDLGVKPERIAEKMDLDCEDVILLVEQCPPI